MSQVHGFFPPIWEIVMELVGLAFTNCRCLLALKSEPSDGMLSLLGENPLRICSPLLGSSLVQAALGVPTVALSLDPGILASQILRPFACSDLSCCILLWPKPHSGAGVFSSRVPLFPRKWCSPGPASSIIWLFWTPDQPRGRSLSPSGQKLPQV